MLYDFQHLLTKGFRAMSRAERKRTLATQIALNYVRAFVLPEHRGSYMDFVVETLAAPPLPDDEWQAYKTMLENGPQQVIARDFARSAMGQPDDVLDDAIQTSEEHDDQKVRGRFRRLAVTLARRLRDQFQLADRHAQWLVRTPKKRAGRNDLIALYISMAHCIAFVRDEARKAGLRVALPLAMEATAVAFGATESTAERAWKQFGHVPVRSRKENPGNN